MALYLITGVAGFIGSSIARALLERGRAVRGIDNLSTGKRENIEEIKNRIEFREADLLDLEAVPQRLPGRGLHLSRSRHSFGAQVREGSARQQSGQRRRHRACPDRRARCWRQASGIRGLVLRLRRHAHASQARSDDTESDLALRGRQTGQRVLHDVVLPLLRPGDRQPALLQHLRSAPGSDVALLGRAGEVHHPDARAANNPPSSATAARAATSPTSTTRSMPTCWPPKRPPQKPPEKSSTLPPERASTSTKPASCCKNSPAIAASTEVRSRSAKVTSSTRWPTSPAPSKLSATSPKSASKKASAARWNGTRSRPESAAELRSPSLPCPGGASYLRDLGMRLPFRTRLKA